MLKVFVRIICALTLLVTSCTPTGESKPESRWDNLGFSAQKVRILNALDQAADEFSKSLTTKTYLNCEVWGPEVEKFTYGATFMGDDTEIPITWQSNDVEHGENR